MAHGRPIDHLVVAVGDLDAAARRFTDLGFTLTPRARHPDHMGTANRLIQFADRSFIELVTVDRPAAMRGHDRTADPPHFSFGAHIAGFLSARGDGMAALVLASDDAHAAAQAYRAQGLDSYAPQDFARQATGPDGKPAQVAFSLAFVTSPAMPGLAFYVCQNRFPENFWKPEFQHHANGASGLARVYMAASAPERHRRFLEQVIGSRAERSRRSGRDALRVPCGADQALVLAPAPAVDRPPLRDPAFIGIDLCTHGRTPARIDDACGLFIDWRAQ